MLGVITRLEAEGLPAETKQLTEFAMSAALVAYRSRVARDYLYADYRGIAGITRAEHAVSLLLDDVYIVPRLLPERDLASLRQPEKDSLALLENPDLPPEQLPRLEEEYAVLTGERWRPGKKAQGGEVSVGEALAQARHIVVVGGPGVGKSALTRYLDRKSTRLNSSHSRASRMPSSA